MRIRRHAHGPFAIVALLPSTRQPRGNAAASVWEGRGLGQNGQPDPISVDLAERGNCRVRRVWKHWSAIASIGDQVEFESQVTLISLAAIVRAVHRRFRCGAPGAPGFIAASPMIYPRVR